MQRDRLVRLLDQVRAVTSVTRDRRVIEQTLAATAVLRAYCDAQDLVATRALEAMGVPAEVVLAQATRCDARDAERVIARTRTTERAPGFGVALADGKVAAAHVDELAGSLRRLEPAQQTKLLAKSTTLLAAAGQSTPEQFRRTLRTEERRLATDDGVATLDRQRASVRLRSRVELDSGMSVFTLTVDPATGLKLHNQIAAATEALFHHKTPPHCPSDPIDKHAFLRAHALLRIIDGKGIRLARPEAIVVVDTTVTDPATGGPIIDWSLPVELPVHVLHDVFNRADLHPIITHNGAILHAPGELNLGRSTRLANRAQRRALRAIYATCAIPDCATRFDHCTIHHIHWWRNGGTTDLHNLIPLCTKHHHLIHEAGWQLHLTPNRTLTITLPNTTTMKTGPPRRKAA